MSAVSPRRILMTLDAVGGVWRYAIDLCKALGSRRIEVVLVGLGPRPSDAQRREVGELPHVRLVWLDHPLDWMAEREADLDVVPARLAALADELGIDLFHLNLPSQAHRLDTQLPVVVASHSCVVTWWEGVKETPLPAEWRWQEEHNRGGFDAADIVLAPTRSHADALARCYGAISRLHVVHNASANVPPYPTPKEPFIFAAGRWWDEGKNALTLDRAVRESPWPVLMAGACADARGQRVTLDHAQALGELPHAEVAALIGRAGIVASPSLYEPFGLVALEGAQAGAPLLLADIPAYRELWEGIAIFADPRDPEAFAKGAKRLALDPALRAELGEAAAVRARKFTLDAQAEALLAAYGEAAANRRLLTVNAA